MGQIIGSASNAVQDSLFVWKDDKPIELNSLIPAHSGWLLTGVSSINNHGQIVGTGIHNGKTRAFLLTPVLPGQKRLKLD